MKNTEDIAANICPIHDAYYTPEEYNQQQNLENDAYSLIMDAYQLVGASPNVSNDTRRIINTAISTVQTLLSVSPIDYNALQLAVDNLRYQLHMAGLQ